MTGGPASNREIVIDFARLFYTERDVPAAFEKYVAPDYIQHNPTIADGRDAAIEALREKFAQPGARFEIQRILVDGDHALIHVKAQGPEGPAAAVADIYRLNEGMIVEHWDVLQPMPSEVANAHPMF